MDAARTAEFAPVSDYALTMQSGSGLITRYAEFDTLEIYVRHATLADGIAKQLGSRPRRLPVRDLTLARLLMNAGFSCELCSVATVPVTHFIARRDAPDEVDGEFITTASGSRDGPIEVQRAGIVAAGCAPV